MIIAYCSDLHGVKLLYESFFEKAVASHAQILLFGGDLGPKAVGSWSRLVDVQREFWKDYLLPKMNSTLLPTGFILGNDDARLIEDELVRSAPPNVSYLHKAIGELGGLLVGGYAFTNRLPFRFKDWEKPELLHDPPMTDPKFDIRTIPAEGGSLQDDFRELEKHPRCREAIWVIHVPPFNTALDVIHDFRHVGSRVVRRFIERNQPVMALHGHIHESPQMSGAWKDLIGNTPCFNAGSNPFHNQGWMIVADTNDPGKAQRIALHGMA